MQLMRTNKSALNTVLLVLLALTFLKRCIFHKDRKCANASTEPFFVFFQLSVYFYFRTKHFVCNKVDFVYAWLICFVDYILLNDLRETWHFFSFWGVFVSRKVSVSPCLMLWFWCTWHRSTTLFVCVHVRARVTAWHWPRSVHCLILSSPLNLCGFFVMRFPFCKDVFVGEHYRCCVYAHKAWRPTRELPNRRSRAGVPRGFGRRRYSRWWCVNAKSFWHKLAFL